MYLYKNGLLPDNFNDMFLLTFVTVKGLMIICNCDVHSY